jgi:selenium-binding protein 1
VALLRPNNVKPDAMAVVDIDPGSPDDCRTVHQVELTHPGDELHHFGWNVWSSMLCPLTGHPFTERRYLIVPGIRSSRLYIIDTKPDATQAKIVKVIEPEELLRSSGPGIARRANSRPSRPPWCLPSRPIRTSCRRRSSRSRRCPR